MCKIFFIYVFIIAHCCCTNSCINNKGRIAPGNKQKTSTNEALNTGSKQEDQNKLALEDIRNTAQELENSANALVTQIGQCAEAPNIATVFKGIEDSVKSFGDFRKQLEAYRQNVQQLKQKDPNAIPSAFHDKLQILEHQIPCMAMITLYTFLIVGQNAREFDSNICFQVDDMAAAKAQEFFQTAQEIAILGDWKLLTMLKGGLYKVYLAVKQIPIDRSMQLNTQVKNVSEQENKISSTVLENDCKKILLDFMKAKTKIHNNRLDNNLDHNETYAAIQSLQQSLQVLVTSMQELRACSYSFE